MSRIENNIMDDYAINQLDKLGVLIAKNQSIPGKLIISVPELSPDGKLSGEEITKKVEETINRIITNGECSSGVIQIISTIRKE